MKTYRLKVLYRCDSGEHGDVTFSVPSNERRISADYLKGVVSDFAAGIVTDMVLVVPTRNGERAHSWKRGLGWHAETLEV